MTELLKELHINHLKPENYNNPDTIEYYLIQHLKMAGAYWSMTAMACLKQNQYLKENKENLCQWILSCQNSDGGFGGEVGHDSHITSTHYAVLLLILLEADETIEKISASVASYIKSLQNPDGSFSGDKWGETDTRFSYCAVSCLTLLNKISEIEGRKAAEYLWKCKNIDGGFGGMPDMESHAAYTFCSMGALFILGEFENANTSDLVFWLSERQTETGGFNGRPEKLPDVCYSWWVFSCVAMLNCQDMINLPALEHYILSCQDNKKGGITDRPGNPSDVFHTFFGLASLSLMCPDKYDLDVIDPAFAIPKTILRNRLSKTGKSN